MPANPRAVKFVRRLLPDRAAALDAKGMFRAPGEPPVSLAAAPVAALVSAGVLARSGASCRPTAEARGWLRRQLLGADAVAAQHREALRLPDGRLLNLAESPLARLAVATAGEAPFLAPHQVEAGERVRRLTERAQLRQRTTMSYDPTRTGGRSAGPAAAPGLGDMALDARRSLDEMARLLPPDCAGVVLDVCGLLKGLQTVEAERGWPRRSAKLVLRIGLDQLARHFGLEATAAGRAHGKARAWMEVGARPSEFG